MTISVGDTLPDVKLIKATDEGPDAVQASEYFKGKKVALFSVPGAFTPTCSAKHLPGFVEKADELKAKGIDVEPDHKSPKLNKLVGKLQRCDVVDNTILNSHRSLDR